MRGSRVRSPPRSLRTNGRPLRDLRPNAAFTLIAGFSAMVTEIVPALLRLEQYAQRQRLQIQLARLLQLGLGVVMIVPPGERLRRLLIGLAEVSRFAIARAISKALMIIAANESPSRGISPATGRDECANLPKTVSRHTAVDGFVLPSPNLISLMPDTDISPTISDSLVEGHPGRPVLPISIPGVRFQLLK